MSEIDQAVGGPIGRELNKVDEVAKTDGTEPARQAYQNGKDGHRGVFAGGQRCEN